VLCVACCGLCDDKYVSSLIRLEIEGKSRISVSAVKSGIRRMKSRDVCRIE
jgi:hypothetical protein